VTSVDRLMFSTDDYPFQRPTSGEIGAFLRRFGSADDRQKFTSDNAAALYGLQLTACPNPQGGPATKVTEKPDPIERAVQ
jgi:hypothetical protein